MVMHGFGGVGTGSPPVDEIAAEISKIKGVIYANVVEGPRYNIMFEFDPHNLGMTQEELIAKINKIEGVHRGKTDVWTILRSYKKGRPHPKPHDY